MEPKIILKTIFPCVLGSVEITMDTQKTISIYPAPDQTFCMTPGCLNRLQQEVDKFKAVIPFVV